jgi:hypothetical protein
MNESDLKGDLVRLVKDMFPHWVVLRHEDHFTHGIPDISVTGNKRTSWIEVKHATPSFKSKGIQELTMLKLARSGIAFYVVYWQKKEQKRTYLVQANEIMFSSDTWNCFCHGFNHAWVVEKIKEAHYDH